MQHTQIKELDASTLDYSMLSRSDLVNIVLQRSDILHDVPRRGELIRKWSAGDTAPLDAVVQSKGVVLAQRAVRIIQTEFEVLKPQLDALGPKKIADIGCGYAFFDLFAYHRYGCDLMLIDIEDNEHRHFGFEDQGAAYTDLTIAKAFLTANGVPDEKITLWNPNIDDVEVETKPDLAVSFLSCGFHFPVDMYLPFMRFGVAPGGSIILDLRNSEFQDSRRALQRLGKLSQLGRKRGYRRVCLKKGKS